MLVLGLHNASHFKIGEDMYIILYRDKKRRPKIGFHCPKSINISRITQQEFIKATGAIPDYPQVKKDDDEF